MSLARRSSRTIFAKETELCAAFIEAVRRVGQRRREEWQIYPETCGFDIVIARKGIQLGIEAKLALNAKVITQSLPSIYSWSAAQSGPHYRAVLVPDYATGGLDEICGRLGITVIRQRVPVTGQSDYESGFDPHLPTDRWTDEETRWHEWCPAQPLKLPDYIPDVIAGDAAPVALTPWKVKAIKLAIILEQRPVHRSDFKALGLSPSRWTDKYTGWLQATSHGYIAGPKIPNFKLQHPRNYEEIRADQQVWMPKAAPRQAALEGV